jgi:hypothetical protein
MILTSLSTATPGEQTSTRRSSAANLNERSRAAEAHFDPSDWALGLASQYNVDRTVINAAYGYAQSSSTVATLRATEKMCAGGGRGLDLYEQYARTQMCPGTAYCT